MFEEQKVIEEVRRRRNDNAISEESEKNELEIKLPDEREKIFYGKIPQDLLRNPKIESGPKALWALVHSYAKEKDLNGIPTIFTSQEKMGKDLGVTDRTIRRWFEVLKETGWAKIKRRGQGKSNVVLLYSKKR